MALESIVTQAMTLHEQTRRHCILNGILSGTDMILPHVKLESMRAYNPKRVLSKIHIDHQH